MYMQLMRDNKELPKPPAPFIPLLESDLAYKDSKNLRKMKSFGRNILKKHLSIQQ